MNLNKIATVNSGFSFREKVRHNPAGTIGVVQMRNLINDYSAIDMNLDRIKDEGMKPKYILGSGDILLVSKGANNRALLFNGFAEKAIASSTFFVLKINRALICPEYLHWFLNHPITQNKFKKQQSGTYTPTLKISPLQNLEVPLPRKDKQAKIGKLYQLQLREKSLQQLLIENRQTLIDNLLINTLKHEK